MSIVTALLRFAERLRFKTLFLLTGGLFVLDLAVPDFIPFVDELILGLLTLLFAMWRKKPDRRLEHTVPEAASGDHRGPPENRG